MSQLRTQRHDGWTPAIRTAFLDALAATGMVRPALAAVGKGASAAYALRRRDPEFRDAWDAALADAVVPVATALMDHALATRAIDTRFALRLLTRLDRKAERHAASARSAQSAHKADSAAESRL